MRLDERHKPGFNEMKDIRRKCVVIRMNTLRNEELMNRVGVTEIISGSKGFDVIQTCGAIESRVYEYKVESRRDRGRARKGWLVGVEKECNASSLWKDIANGKK